MAARMLRVNDLPEVYKGVLDAREPFQTRGGLSGVTDWNFAKTGMDVPDALKLGANYTLYYFGRLPVDSYKDQLGDVDYVIYSFSTPIAWHLSLVDRWVVPGVIYSNTTSKHQSKIRSALTYQPPSDYTRGFNRGMEAGKRTAGMDYLTGLEAGKRQAEQEFEARRLELAAIRERAREKVRALEALKEQTQARLQEPVLVESAPQVKRDRFGRFRRRRLSE